MEEDNISLLPQIQAILSFCIHLKKTKQNKTRHAYKFFIVDGKARGLNVYSFSIVTEGKFDLPIFILAINYVWLRFFSRLKGLV